MGSNLRRMMPAPRSLVLPPWLMWFLLVSLFLVQIAFGRAVAPLRAAIEQMPSPPGQITTKVLAFGDEEFLFRALSHWLQDVGDGGGRVRPLRDYDYDRVVGWLQALDRMDDQSDYPFSLAAHYFGAITDPAGAPPRVAKIAEYFCTAALAQPARRWPWLVSAAAMARRSGMAPGVASDVAGAVIRLRDDPSVPRWLPLLAIPLYHRAGQDDLARRLEADPELIGIRQELRQELGRRLRNLGVH